MLCKLDFVVFDISGEILHEKPEFRGMDGKASFGHILKTSLPAYVFLSITNLHHKIEKCNSPHNFAL